MTVTLPASVWDVIDENYGNGPGEVSFNASYVYSFGSTAPDETLSAGIATLDLHQGAGVKYPVKSPSVPAWNGGGADVTLEWKLAFHAGASAFMFLAENQSSGSSSWGHILSFDRDYVNGYQANELEDYYTRDGASLAPPGFDSSLPHVYRLVRQGGINSWYLDGQLLKQPLLTGGGAAPDGLRLEWGFYENDSSPSSVDVFYVKAANAALIPGPADHTPPSVVSAIRGKTDYNKVTVTYSEPVQAGTAINPINYSINHGGPIVAAAEVNSTTFALTLTSGLAENVTNILTISGVRDLAGNLITPGTQATVTILPMWDVMDEKYGNAEGEVSFNASYLYAFGSTAPPETLAPGKATLSLDQGSAVKYPVKTPASLPAWAGGGADVTIEWKIAYRDGAGGHIYLAENQAGAASSWGHILSFNNDYNSGAYEADSIEDYYTRDGVSVAPVGFDSSLPHVYRIVRRAGTNSWYLDGSVLKEALVNGGGAAGDGLRLEWGFNENPASASSVDVYYFKAGNGAFVPGEVTLHFVRNGNQLTFSWEGTGYALEENSVLTNAGGWTNTPNGNVSPVTVTIGPGNKFFRLKQ